MLQKSYAEGLRALALYTATLADKSHLHPEDDHWAKLEDLLLPMVKGYGSETSYELLKQSLQIFGGSGYTQDYPLEQYIRDAKIDTIYEGTTAIQGLDLFFRKIVRDQGQTLMRFSESILDTIKGGADELAAEREMLGQALEDVQAQIGAMVGYSMASQQDPEQIYKTGLHTTKLLESLSEVVIGWLLIRHAEVAVHALPEASTKDRAFYEGKIASARFFAKDAFPRIRLRREAAEEEDGALMEIPIEAF